MYADGLLVLLKIKQFYQNELFFLLCTHNIMQYSYFLTSGEYFSVIARELQLFEKKKPKFLLRLY